MELFEFLQRIIQRSPFIRCPDHKGRQVDHLGAQRLQLTPALSLLLLGPGHDHGVPLEGTCHGVTSSSFTMSFTCWNRAFASASRPCSFSRVMATKNPLRAPSISPPMSRATAMFW